MQEFLTGSDVFTVDADYYKPELAAIHLVREGSEITIIDTGTQYSVPRVESALASLGLDFSAVKYIFLTHIHLDHAGGASTLMKLCENATLVVHERGARHMADPQKLIAGSIAVYGEQEFRQLYGEIQPIDATRIISPHDGDTLRMGKREFKFIDTPGHARHHFCIFDRTINAVYTGDTLGIAYRTLRDPEHAFVMPTTTPVQFDPAALHDSIDKVMALQPNYLFCTHYSLLQPSAANIAGLHEQIDDFCMLTEQASAQAEQFVSELSKRLKDYAVRRASNELQTVSTNTIEEWVSLDSSLSAQGLAHWWQQNRAT